MRAPAPARRQRRAAAKGAVVAWGGNDYGQLGDGSTTNRAEPVFVKGFDGTGRRAVLVACGNCFSAIVDSGRAARRAAAADAADAAQPTASS